MAQRPYITPSNVPTARKSRCLSFPDSLEWEALINGFLAMGTRKENWQQLDDTSLTPDEAVEACVLLLNDFFEAGECVDMTPIGAIQMWTTGGAPAGWLMCNGQEYGIEEYPALYAVIGSVFGGDDEFVFNVPNFVNRSPMGYADVIPAIGYQAGEMTHTLTVNEMPAHQHAQDNGAGDAYQAAAAGARSTIGGNTTSSTARIMTDNTGGGLPHNNLHPVLGIAFIIYAGV